MMLVVVIVLVFFIKIIERLVWLFFYCFFLGFEEVCYRSETEFIFCLKVKEDREERHRYGYQ